MSKRFILLCIAISILLFSNCANSEQKTSRSIISSSDKCQNDELAFVNRYGIDCISEKYIEQKIKEQKSEWDSERFPIIGCAHGKFPVYRGYSIIYCASQKEIKQSKQNHFDYIDTYERLEKKQIIECFIIGFIIITIMSLPINILWRFRLKIPAFLFAILTVLSVIAIPFIFS